DTSTLVKPGDTTVSVKTGDETSLGMLMSLVGLSVLGLVYSKRKRESI
ncbi:LPXTG cell wall anchor domain-containing protein, partial [Thomasclavelia cocleata]